MHISVPVVWKNRPAPGNSLDSGNRAVHFHGFWPLGRVTLRYLQSPPNRAKRLFLGCHFSKLPKPAPKLCQIEIRRAPARAKHTATPNNQANMSRLLQVETAPPPTKRNPEDARRKVLIISPRVSCCDVLKLRHERYFSICIKEHIFRQLEQSGSSITCSPLLSW